MFLGVVGPFQIILFLSIPIIIFAFGYMVGKKAGYIKRIKETESKKH